MAKEPKEQETVNLICKSADVLGGDARIRGTRIPVWLLTHFVRLGESNESMLANYPGLTADDLQAAVAYTAEHPKEIHDALVAQELEEP